MLFCHIVQAQENPCPDEVYLTSPDHDFNGNDFEEGAIVLLTATNTIENSNGEYKSENLIFLDDGFKVTDSEFLAHITDLCLVSSSEEHYIINKIAGNYPNPFQESTTITFSLIQMAEVSVEIYGANGQFYKAIQPLTIFPEGTHEIMFHADGLPSGIYFYKSMPGRKLLQVE